MSVQRPRPRRRLFAVITPNGRLVHLAPAQTIGNLRLACGRLYPWTLHRVHARITCARCIQNAPRAAARVADRPKVIGLDFSAFYDAMGNMFRAGADGATLEGICREVERATVRPILGGA